MHIYSITDHNAGNRRQASALASALQSDSQPHHCTLNPNAAARLFAPRNFPRALSSLGAEFSHLAQYTSPQLAIGCGRQAALATRLLRQRGWKSIQILNPRLSPHHWDIVIAPEHDQLSGDNVLTVLGSLNPIDDVWLQHARLEFPMFDTLPRPITSVLIGGNTHHATHAQHVFHELARDIKTIMQHSGSLLLTTSRRTDPAVAEWLKQELHSFPGMIWTGEHDGRNPYAAFLAYADHILCTADSVNMLSEACATYAPVSIVAPEMASRHVRRYIDVLIDKQRAQWLAQALPLQLQNAIPIRETARIAEAIHNRLRIS